MSHFTKVAGVWRNSKPYVKVAGTWKLVDYFYNKVGGRWYTSFVKGGLVDKSWDDRDQTGVFGTGANGVVGALTIQSDGKIIVGGGQFTSWNGTTVGYIVRLNSDGTRDTAFTTNNGTGANNVVYSIAIQSDGKIVLGGSFTSWNGTTVGRIVRLNSDGTRDTAFSTNTGTGANSSFAIVLTNAIQSDGKILIGGDFTSWNGTTVGFIVRLNSDGTRDTAFTTNIGTGANNTVRSIAIQSDGKILVGGIFSTWNGTTVNRIVRLNSDGTRDTSFTTNIGTGAASSIRSIAIQSDGKILVGGDFTTWNGTTVGYIVRLNSDGTRDTAFTTNIGTGANNTVRSIAIQSDGKILVGGDFTSWNAVTVGYIVRLNSDGTRDTTFTTNTGTGASSLVYAIAVQSDGKILVGGFTSWDGTAVGYIVRLNSDGTNSETLSSFASTSVRAIAIQSDGKIIVGGAFGGWNGVLVNRLVRLNLDGTRDTAFSTNVGTGANNAVNSIVIQPDGKILLGGSFSFWNGTLVNYIVRLNSDGTRDTTFTTNTGTGGNSLVLSTVIQSDGKILIGGQFTSWNGTTVGRIVRLNSDGTLDTTFTTNNGTGGSSIVQRLAIQSDGKIVLVGFFTAWNGTTVGRIVRLNSDGTRDTAFPTYAGTGPNSNVYSIAIQSDGQILVGGLFSGWSGVTAGRIVRLNADGTLDTTFVSNTGTGGDISFINSIAVQSDGKIVLGGGFTVFNGTTAGRIVRLNTDGTLDTAFTTNTGTGANAAVNEIVIQPDKKILVGGVFTIFRVANEFRRSFVRIGGEDAS